MNLPEAKAWLRKTLTQNRISIGKNTRRRLSHKISRRLLGSKMYKKSILLSLLIVVISIGLIPAILHGASQTESKAFEGYTLIAPFYHRTTYLIDMEGNIVGDPVIVDEEV